jgi:hypothetical protein
MPPVVTAAQGSRSGLITTTIISVVIAVAMIVIAVYYSQEASKTEKNLSDERLTARGMYSEGMQSDPRVTALQNLAKEQFPGMTGALDISLAQSDQLAKLVGANSAADANTTARNTIQASSKQIAELNSQKLVNFTLNPSSSLAEAVKAMTSGVAQLAQDKKNSDDQVAALQKKLQDQVASEKATLDDKDKQIADANTKAEAAQKQLADFQKQVADATTAVSQTGGAKLTELQTANATLTNDLQAANKKLAAEEKQINDFKTKLKNARINPAEAVVRQPDGTIIRVVDNNTCFISIGSRQSVIRGLTFEIYDKSRGIPPLGDGMSDTNMPVGKASIEVVAVQPDTSECRIVKTAPGQQVVIGDLIENLVFDPNTRYNFVVYGDFDLSNSGSTGQAQDAEIIKRLITQWGGKLQDHVDVNTDFVVLGIQPEVPNITDQTNPNEVLRKQAAEAKLKQYNTVLNDAEKLSIPVMNQNRFLYFIGYYDQARR